MSTYNIEFDFYKFYMENLNNPLFIEAEKKRQILQKLKNTKSANINFKNKKGIIEPFFLEKLNFFFPNEIYTDMVIEHFKSWKTKDGAHSAGIQAYNPYVNEFTDPYSPDFIFKSQKTGMHIDIEIDEPYSLKTKEIFHAYDDLKDGRRNRYFLEKGWFIVRFAEEQIIKSPEACCFLISELIEKITGDDGYLDKFENHKEPIAVAKWEKNDTKMIEENYRENYLKNFAQQWLWCMPQIIVDKMIKH